MEENEGLILTKVPILESLSAKNKKLSIFLEFIKKFSEEKSYHLSKNYWDVHHASDIDIFSLRC